jgi:hypothetical protein
MIFVKRLEKKMVGKTGNWTCFDVSGNREICFKIEKEVYNINNM